MDSHMYQTVGHEAIELVAQALQLPLYRRNIAGGSVAIDKVHSFQDWPRVPLPLLFFSRQQS